MLRRNRLRKGRHLARAASDLSARSLVAALEAASVSPTEWPRLPALMSVFTSVVNNKDPGDKPVLPGDYARLMAMAENRGSRTAGPESPHPAQPAVLVGWRGETLRFLPGATQVAAVQFEVLEELCSIIDPILIEARGYGLGDVVELTLRRIDHVVTSVAEAWGDEPTPDCPISRGEIEAAASLSCLSTQAEECLYPARAKLALERFTAPPEVLADRSGLWTSIGPAVGVRALHSGAEDGLAPLPAGGLMGPLRDITELLAGKAMLINPETRAMVESEMGKIVFEEMRRRGHPMRGVVSPYNDGQITYLVAEYEGRGALLVDVGATVGQSTADARMERGAKGMHELVGGADSQSSFDTTDLVGMDVMFVQVLFTTDHQVSIERYGAEVADICTFLELLRSLDAPEDLWAILESKAGLDEARKSAELAGWGGIGLGQDLSLLEAWTIWKDHGKRLSPFAVHFAKR